MNQKPQELSHDESSQLLVFVIFLILIIVLFLGTAIALGRTYPEFSSSMKIGSLRLSPDMGLFFSLVFICAVLAVTILGAFFFNTLLFNFLPIMFVCLLGVAGFLFSLFNSIVQCGFTHAITVLGIFSVEGAVIAWGGIKLVDWLDSLYGNFPFSVRKGFFSPNDPKLMPDDSLLDELIGKHK